MAKYFTRNTVSRGRSRDKPQKWPKLNIKIQAPGQAHIEAYNYGTSKMTKYFTRTTVSRGRSRDKHQKWPKLNIKIEASGQAHIEAYTQGISKIAKYFTRTTVSRGRSRDKCSYYQLPKRVISTISKPKIKYQKD